MKNLVGQKFGKLEAIERVRTETKRRDWGYICLCKCGKTTKKPIHTAKLLSGHTASCGCEKKGRPNKVGDEIFIEAVQKSDSLREVLNRCGIKGNDTTSIRKRINELNLDISHFNLISRRFNLTEIDKFRIYYNEYRQAAKYNKRDFLLSLEEFIEIVQSNCAYCGDSPISSDRYSIDKNGVDRINSSIGYLKENCVACCTICNRMKLDLDVEVFLKQAEKIYHARKK